VSTRRVFLVASWVLRQLSSRCACRLYLCGLAIITVPAVLFRVEAALFARQTLSMVSALSNLRVGESSRSEALSLIPSLTPLSGPDGASACEADECLSSGIPISAFVEPVVSTVAGTGNRTLYSTLSILGARVGALDINVNVRAGKVSSFSYRLVLAPPQLNDVDLVVSVAFVDRIPAGYMGDKSLPYKLYASYRAPFRSIHISLAPSAPESIKESAFGLKIGCLISLTGCRTWHQLLPAVEKVNRY
jgi:hypothetical protein